MRIFPQKVNKKSESSSEFMLKIGIKQPLGQDHAQSVGGHVQNMAVSPGHEKLMKLIQHAVSGSQQEDQQERFRIEPLPVEDGPGGLSLGMEESTKRVTAMAMAGP